MAIARYVGVTSKPCRVCLVDKDISEYYWDNKRHKARSHRCKGCTKEYVRRHKREHIEHYKQTHSAYYQKNKVRIAEMDKLRRPAHPRPRRTPQDHKRTQWSGFLRRYHRMTVAAYDALVLRQEGRCAICQRAPTEDMSRRPLYIDHDHATGKTRALLCYRCNSAIGFFEEDEQVMLAAIQYLKDHASHH